MNKTNLHREESVLITYEEFLSLIEEQVSELAGDEYTVRIVSVRRNNSVMLDSMLISKPESNRAGL